MHLCLADGASSAARLLQVRVDGRKIVAQRFTALVLREMSLRGFKSHGLAYTRDCHYQYRMVYGAHKGDREGVVFCAIVVQSHCNSVGNAGGNRP